MRRQAKVSKVTAGLHRLDLGGVNVYLIEDGRELALIDTGFPGQSGAILSAVEGLGRRPTDLRHIVLTHAHPDHVGSAAALVTATGARTYMHRLDVPIAEGRIENRPLEPAPDPLMRGLFVLLSLSKPDVDPVRIGRSRRGRGCPAHRRGPERRPCPRPLRRPGRTALAFRRRAVSSRTPAPTFSACATPSATRTARRASQACVGSPNSTSRRPASDTAGPSWRTRTNGSAIGGGTAFQLRQR